jgi:hypothetical protein
MDDTRSRNEDYIDLLSVKCYVFVQYIAEIVSMCMY